ncbi:recombinase family protein [Legionella norrlandica]|uniref:recombinase family protein n=1 Tax=Legionella norrlandica TaxID=1498499 RepID=UPI000B1E9E23|nr:recombinase family protein [Legionella norrlandica]
MKAGIYARVSTHDQQTLNMQIEAMKKYVNARDWQVETEISEIGSGAKDSRPQREELINQAKRREIDVIIVWKLDRWGRSVNDLFHTLHELNALGVGFISLTEALDLTTATGRAMARLLAIFAEFEREILRERVKAGISHARSKGKSHGRPASTKKFESDVITE